MGHTGEEIAAFSNGETRLVYAAVRLPAQAPLVLLEDGAAIAEREHAKRALRCFVPDCASPALTTVDRSKSNGRDGFRHLNGGHHEPEGLFHQQGKQALINWLGRAQPDVDARAEVSPPGCPRKADVLATFPNRELVALEVQYAALTASGDRSSWQARTDDYLASGITPVWLFGHYGRQMTVEEDRVLLGAVHSAVLAMGTPLVWLNPTTDQVAIAYVHAEVAGRTYEVLPTATDRSARLHVTSLDHVRLTPRGLDGGFLAHLRKQALDRDRALQEQRRREQARREWEAQQAALRAAKQKAADERAAARSAAQEKSRAEAQARAASRREQWLIAQREREDQWRRDWEVSSTRERVVAHYGELPDHLDLPTTGRGIHLHRQHWQALVFGHLMLNATGRTVTARDGVAALRARHVRVDLPAGREMLDEWFTRLADLGHVRALDGGSFVVTDPATECARQEAEAAAAKEAADRIARERELREAQDIRAAAAELAAEWEGSDDHRAFLERFDGMPWVVTASPYPEVAWIAAGEQQWRAALLPMLIRERCIEEKRCVGHLRGRFKIARAPEFRLALRHWLDALVNAGYLTRHTVEGMYWVEESLRQLDSQWRAGASAAAAATGAGQVTCLICRRPLAPDLAAVGSHVGCNASAGRAVVVAPAPHGRRLRTCKGCALPIDEAEGAYHPQCRPGMGPPSWARR